jgi:small-conductance mechanosensitive channel
MSIPYVKMDLAGLAGSVLKLAIIIVLALVAIKLVRRVIIRSLNKRSGNKRTDTLKSILISISKYTILFIAAVTILKTVFHIDATTIVAAAGIGGLAIGFGAQNLVRDVITGMFILIEEQYQVGDRVTINGFSGEVVEIGFRTTKLKNESNDFYMVSNGDVKSVVNHSKEPDGMMLDLCLPYEAIDSAKKIVGETGERLKREYSYFLEAPAAVGVVSKDLNGYYLRIKAVVEDGMRKEALVLMQQEILDAFAQNSIHPVIIKEA